MSIKLNIGSGPIVIPEFQNIDRKLGMEAYPLEFPDGSVDEIRASHILEHFSIGDARAALEEWYRVLVPGGRIRIAVPDMQKAVRIKGQMRQFVLMGGQMDENDFHKSAYDEEILDSFMNRAGFVNVKPWESDGLDTSSHPASLNLEGFKPLEEVKDGYTLKAVMSIPRLGFNDMWGCVQEALTPRGIPVAGYQGAFWGQCMQRAFNDALAADVEWILTLDYDSMFTSDQLDQMLDIFKHNPRIDALAPLQIKRGEHVHMLTPVDGPQSGRVEVTRWPIEVKTAHFGLTLLRTSALKKLAKPWFQCVPNPETGEYDDERQDGDIFFWNRWREAGNTVFVTPSVGIGHLETMCVWVNEDGQKEFITAKEWRERSKAA